MVKLNMWSDESSEGKLPIKKKRKLNIVILKQQRILCILCRCYSSINSDIDKYILTMLCVKSSVSYRFDRQKRLGEAGINNEANCLC